MIDVPGVTRGDESRKLQRLVNARWWDFLPGQLLMLTSGNKRGEHFEVGPGLNEAEIVRVDETNMVENDELRVQQTDRTVLERVPADEAFGDCIDVTHPDFGAVGDGVADDRAAIQAALDVADGARVCVPPGTYLVSDRLILRDNSVLYGAGYASEIRGGAGAFYILDTDDNVSHVHVSHLRLDSQDQTGNGCIRFQGTHDAVVEYCFIYNAKSYTILMLDQDGREAQDIRIYNNLIDNTSGQSAIYAYASSTSVESECIFVKGNTINGSGGDAVNLNVAGHAIVANNVLNYFDEKGGSNAGVRCDESHNGEIVGNIIGPTDAGDPIGVYVADSSDITVQGNECRDIGSQGIYVDNSNNSIVNDNIVLNSGGSNDDDAGIRINDAEDVVVNGNRSYDDRSTKYQSYGVLEFGSSDYNIITDNACRGNSTSGVYVSGANTVSANNTG
jgi:parallel beta-helix repeat protein